MGGGLAMGGGWRRGLVVGSRGQRGYRSAACSLTLCSSTAWRRCCISSAASSCAFASTCCW